jgi:hypothetical protein
MFTVLAARRLRLAEISCPAFEKMRSLERLGTDVATMQKHFRASGASSRYTSARHLHHAIIYGSSRRPMLGSSVDWRTNDILLTRRKISS